MSEQGSEQGSGIEPVPAATVVLISGASRGLGLAMVTDLLERGVKVAAFARTVTPELETLAATYPEASYFGSVDITDDKGSSMFVCSDTDHCERAAAALDGDGAGAVGTEEVTA